MSGLSYRYLAFILLIGLTSCKDESTVQPQRKNIIETVYASGSIIPLNEYTSFALANGIVIEKRATDGDIVSKGDIIYVILNEAQSARYSAAQQAYSIASGNLAEGSPILSELRLAVQSAAAKFKTDSAQYVRYRNLLDSGIITRSQFDDVSAGYTISQNQKRAAEERYASTVRELRLGLSNAQSQLAAARSDLDNYFIRAEQSGVVFQLLKDVGEAVRAGEQVALFGEAKERLIKLAVDQQDIDRIRIGQQVLLKTDLTGNKIYEAKVIKLYPVMNPADQTFRVDAEFVSAPPSQYIYSSVEANIVIQKKDNALVIPRRLLLPGDSVIVRAEGEAKRVAVKTGIVTLDDAEIISGINEKTEVVDPSDR
jgi:multidrug efflux pump subunit AcrA (membrane-fusion protein)